MKKIMKITIMTLCLSLILCSSANAAIVVEEISSPFPSFAETETNKKETNIPETEVKTTAVATKPDVVVGTTKPTITTEKETETEITTDETKVVNLNATVNVNVPSSLSGDIVVSFYNRTTKETIHYKFLEETNYSQILILPIGIYSVTKITYEKDYGDRFKYNETNFYIGDMLNIMVGIDLFDSQNKNFAINKDGKYYIKGEETTTQLSVDDLYQHIENIEEENIEDITLSNEDDEKTEDKSSNEWIRTIIPVVLLIAIIFVYFYKKKIKNSNEITVDATVPKNRY